jgi:hypothetical protein
MSSSDSAGRSCLLCSRATEKQLGVFWTARLPPNWNMIACDTGGNNRMISLSRRFTEVLSILLVGSSLLALQQPAKSVNDGVYTTEQATRAKRCIPRDVQLSCAHGRPVGLLAGDDSRTGRQPLRIPQVHRTTERRERTSTPRRRWMFRLYIAGRKVPSRQDGSLYG